MLLFHISNFDNVRNKNFQGIFVESWYGSSPPRGYIPDCLKNGIIFTQTYYILQIYIFILNCRDTEYVYLKW